MELWNKSGSINRTCSKGCKCPQGEQGDTTTFREEVVKEVEDKKVSITGWGRHGKACCRRRWRRRWHWNKEHTAGKMSWHHHCETGLILVRTTGPHYCLWPQRAVVFLSGNFCSLQRHRGASVLPKLKIRWALFSGLKAAASEDLSSEDPVHRSTSLSPGQLMCMMCHNWDSLASCHPRETIPVNRTPSLRWSALELVRSNT